MTVRQLESEMTTREFADWQVLAQVEAEERQNAEDLA